ncbi:MAG: hypothetical protein INF43_05820 [Alphaproteobacteria bacterium]|jgi:hypothetical protein|nr:hypothetical protein [Alphaproteobacteria bacterium]
MNQPMSATRLRQTTSLVTMLSVLPHLLCCGIPALTALIALGSTVGLAASLAGNPFYQLVDTYHTELVLLAIASVAFSGVMNFIAYRIDCREAAQANQAALVHGTCHHGDCTPKKNTSLKLFAISCVLLALDLTWFYTEEHVLGLHHHGHEATAVAHAHDHHH